MRKIGPSMVSRSLRSPAYFSSWLIESASKASLILLRFSAFTRAAHRFTFCCSSIMLCEIFANSSWLTITLFNIRLTEVCSKNLLAFDRYNIIMAYSRTRASSSSFEANILRCRWMFWKMLQRPIKRAIISAPSTTKPNLTISLTAI